MTDTEQTEQTEQNIAEQARVIFGETYLRRRPFLLVTELSRPSGSVKTEKAKWQEEPGAISRFEVPSIVDSVKPRQLREAAIVIDILNRSIVKNRHQALGTPEQFVDHYMEKFAEQITEGLGIWARQSALKVAKAA